MCMPNLYVYMHAHRETFAMPPDEDDTWVNMYYIHKHTHIHIDTLTYRTELCRHPSINGALPKAPLAQPRLWQMNMCVFVQKEA